MFCTLDHFRGKCVHEPIDFEDKAQNKRYFTNVTQC
jgi:hypothetical protein